MEGVKMLNSKLFKRKIEQIRMLLRSGLPSPIVLALIIEIVEHAPNVLNRLR